MKRKKNYFSKEKSSIPSTNPALNAASLLTALSMTAAAQITVWAADESQPDGSFVPFPDTMLTDVDALLGKSLLDRAIYSETYATVAAGSFTNGSLHSGGVTTLGADAIVEGFAKDTDPRTEEKL